MIKTLKPEQLHEWYLDAVRQIEQENFNPKANKPYGELNRQQKYIDEFIADKVNDFFKERHDKAN